MATISFTATMHRFEEKGDKTGWTYIEIPADIAEKINPTTKKGFRVKGKLDNHKIAGAYLQPMGGGTFILPINAEMRKGVGKRHGAMIKVQLQKDEALYEFNKDFMDCLADEPAATTFFKSLASSHQRYFSKWIDDAKTDQTKTKRIAQAVAALARKASYGEMIRSLKSDKNELS
jgi:hypothetical protein